MMSKVMLIGQMVSPSMGVLLKERFKRWGPTLVILLHIVGFLGLASPTSRPLFLALTPYHLILISLLLFGVDNHRWSALFFYLLVAGVVSFSLEAVGVAYGWLFGTYKYGTGLGVGILGVPFLIGLNWAMLGYCSTGILLPLSLPMWQKVCLSSLLLVGFDACLEPAAVGLGFWYWPNGFVPGQNYLGWWLTALPVCTARLVLLPGVPSSVSQVVWWSQFFFFVLLSQFVFTGL